MEKNNNNELIRIAILMPIYNGYEYFNDSFKSIPYPAADTILPGLKYFDITKPQKPFL